MNNLEIAKEILIAAINREHFDDVNKRNNAEIVQDQRVAAICKAFKDIHKAIYESSDEELKFWNSKN